MKTQNKRIKDHLQSGKKLTQMEALNMFGCFRLASRIRDLREEGLNIKTEMIKTSTDKIIAEYSIEKEKGWSEWENIKYF